VKTGEIRGLIARTRRSAGPHKGQLAITQTGGADVGAGGGLALGVSYQATNAKDANDLSGPFYYLTVGGVDGLGAQVTVFWSPNVAYGTDPKDWIYGIQFGPSTGAEASGGTGISNTDVTKLHNWKYILGDVAWSTLNPQLSIPDLLRQAWKLIQQAIGC